jgi:acyl carrier protein
VVQQTSAELELAELLVEALNLDGVEPESIAPDALLFGEGLGLDSIDALEIALAISQKYGVQMKAEDEVTKDAFSTLRSLSAFIERSR